LTDVSRRGSFDPGPLADNLTMFGTFASVLSTTAFVVMGTAAGFMLQDPWSTEFHINVIFLVVVFGVPATRLTAPRDVAHAWRPLLVLTLLGTFAWDVATAFLAGSRPFLSEWYLVYVSGPAVLMLLFMLHAFVADRLARTIQPSERQKK
jgi:peptidoglycan/LPS O-acetylase OafA/YrhL